MFFAAETSTQLYVIAAVLMLRANAPQKDFQEVIQLGTAEEMSKSKPFIPVGSALHP